MVVHLFFGILRQQQHQYPHQHILAPHLRPLSEAEASEQVNYLQGLLVLSLSLTTCSWGLCELPAPRIGQTELQKALGMTTVAGIGAVLPHLLAQHCAFSECLGEPCWSVFVSGLPYLGCRWLGSAGASGRCEICSRRAACNN